MSNIASTLNVPYKRKSFQAYNSCSLLEREKFGLDYEVVKAYEYFYLCRKLDFKGNTLYYECFSKFDVDRQLKAVRKIQGPRNR